MTEKGLTSHILMMSDGSSLRECGRPSRAAILLLSFVSYKTKISSVEILLQTSGAQFYNSQLVYSHLSSDSPKWLLKLTKFQLSRSHSKLTKTSN